jgi:hypothetical protein
VSDPSKPAERAPAKIRPEKRRTVMCGGGYVLGKPTSFSGPDLKSFGRINNDL